MSKQRAEYKRIWKDMRTTWSDLILLVVPQVTVLALAITLSMRNFPLSQFIGELGIYTAVALILMSAMEIGFDFLTARSKLHEADDRKSVIHSSTEIHQERT